MPINYKDITILYISILILDRRDLYAICQLSTSLVYIKQQQLLEIIYLIQILIYLIILLALSLQKLSTLNVCFYLYQYPRLYILEPIICVIQKRVASIYKCNVVFQRIYRDFELLRVNLLEYISLQYILSFSYYYVNKLSNSYKQDLLTSIYNYATIKQLRNRSSIYIIKCIVLAIY